MASPAKSPRPCITAAKGSRLYLKSPHLPLHHLCLPPFFSPNPQRNLTPPAPLAVSSPTLLTLSLYSPPSVNGADLGQGNFPLFTRLKTQGAERPATQGAERPAIHDTRHPEAIQTTRTSNKLGRGPGLVVYITAKAKKKEQMQLYKPHTPRPHRSTIKKRISSVPASQRRDVSHIKEKRKTPLLWFNCSCSCAILDVILSGT